VPLDELLQFQDVLARMDSYAFGIVGGVRGAKFNEQLIQWFENCIMEELRLGPEMIENLGFRDSGLARNVRGLAAAVAVRFEFLAGGLEKTMDDLLGRAPPPAQSALRSRAQIRF
jgi:hypothetical protein